ncbi:hypothetical protein [Reyranella sp. CPCC 100927]|uniref:hypothetical protein n=1 Tax=Reyranella sp. CPCC 100927 TaxID=2599616 RepID=UPI0011B5D677|nr:hypothetical protein [Reyranella sp. CPCC 100927]TWT05931.1 hypothetical protein FQU96_23020 [Reyranella sp. CPCC 100927]
MAKIDKRELLIVDAYVEKYRLSPAEMGEMWLSIGQLSRTLGEVIDELNSQHRAEKSKKLFGD